MTDFALEEFASVYGVGCVQAMRIELEGLSGDAGFRRYYRTNSSPAQIVVDAPPEKENNLAYVRTNLLLNDLGVRVPQIIAVDFSRGNLLLEDLGRSLLWDQVVECKDAEDIDGNGLSAERATEKTTEKSADKLYQQAVEQLLLIQGCESPPQYIPNYDHSLLLAEMELFREWFLGALLDVELDSDRASQLTDFFNTLSNEALAQPKVLVHRDYHARNLMCLGNGELAVIDFQDAVWGPITYDLVSLARDCYLRWSNERLDSFVNCFAGKLVTEGRLSEAQRPLFRRWFDFMGLQRHIKVLGIFARLHLRDGKSGYLNDLPLVLRYTVEVMERFDEFSDMAEWLKADVIPLCEKQPWYADWQTAGSATELV